MSTNRQGAEPSLVLASAGCALADLELLPARLAPDGVLEVLVEVTSLLPRPSRPVVAVRAVARDGGPERRLDSAVIRLDPAQRKWATFRVPAAALAVGDGGDRWTEPAEEVLVVGVEDGDGRLLPEPLLTTTIAVVGERTPAPASWERLPESVTCEGRPVLGVDENLCDPAERDG